MKKSIMILAVVALAFSSCAKNETAEATTTTTEPTSTETTAVGGQEAVVDNDSAPDIVKLAVGTPDLSTLVKAVQAAGLATSLSNAGPFTVFAPTNEAFAKLPAGALDDLMKPENKDKLNDIKTFDVKTLKVYDKNCHQWFWTNWTKFISPFAESSYN